MKKESILWSQDHAELRKQLKDVIDEIFSMLPKQDFSTESGRSTYINSFREEFGKFNYPHDDVPDVEITRRPIMGHRFNTNIVFIIKDDIGEKQRL